MRQLPRKIILGISISLLIFYFSLLGAVFTPNVSNAYERYYIDGSDSTWNGEDPYEYEYGTVLDFTSDPASGRQPVTHLSGGWYEKEPTRSWTRGTSADIYFSPNTSIDSAAVINFHAIAISHQSEQQVTIRANGKQIGTLAVSAKSWNNYNITIPADIIQETGPSSELKITFVIGNPVQPSAIGDSRDDRQLGIAIEWLVIEVSKA